MPGQLLTSRPKKSVISRCAIILLLALCGEVSTASAMEDANSPVMINIASQPVADALRQLADQTGLQFAYKGDIDRRLLAPRISGVYSPIKALGFILAPAGLVVRYVNARTIAIESRDVAVMTIPVSNGGQGNSAENESPSFADGEHGVERAAYIQMTSDASNANGEATSPPAKLRQHLDEVVVTAQKATERLQDVPIPMSAISTDALIANNQLRLQDYYNSIPGLTITPGVQSIQNLSIRGVSTGIGNPTVGVTVDDVPYGASTVLGGGLGVPDIDPDDVARIEVLRGPQGTLYGASSMGGLVKYVTVDPVTNVLSGRVQGGAVDIHNGDGLGFNARGSVNVPLGDSSALRASAFSRKDPGYIDNPINRVDGINSARVSGGRVSAIWRPSELFTSKVSALYQNAKGDGLSDVDLQPPLGDLQQNYPRGVGRYNRKLQAYSIQMTAKVGMIEFTSVSGYNINETSDSDDLTYVLGGLAQALYGVDSMPTYNHNKTDKFSQEIRAVADLGQRAQLLAGVFYTHEKSLLESNIVPVDSFTGLEGGEGIHTIIPTSNEEYAGFTDLTIKIAERLDIQVGGRESEIRQAFRQTQIGPLVPIFNGGTASPFTIDTVSSDANAFTYLVTPRLKLAPDVMIYARFASGYRPGGLNPTARGGVPRHYDPDKTRNYELGIKGEFFDHQLSVDSSLYYIDWKDIQLVVLNPVDGSTYNTNAGGAKSQGAELSANWKTSFGLAIRGWVEFIDAVLTESFPSTSTTHGVEGDRLPYSSRFSGNLSVEQVFPLGGSLSGFVGGSVSYTGSRLGGFTGAPTRTTFPAYAQVDFRGGLILDSWSANVFVNNLADRRGVLSGGVDVTPPFAIRYIQPRTIGVSIAKRF